MNKSDPEKSGNAGERFPPGRSLENPAKRVKEQRPNGGSSSDEKLK